MVAEISDGRYQKIRFRTFQNEGNRFAIVPRSEEAKRGRRENVAVCDALRRSTPGKKNGHQRWFSMDPHGGYLDGGLEQRGSGWSTK